MTAPAVKFCDHCGAPARTDALECRECGFHFRIALHPLLPVADPPASRLSPRLLRAAFSLLLVAALLVLLSRFLLLPPAIRLNISQATPPRQREPYLPPAPPFVPTTGATMADYLRFEPLAQPDPNQRSVETVETLRLRLRSAKNAIDVIQAFGHPYAAAIYDNGSASLEYRGTNGSLQVDLSRDSAMPPRLTILHP